ncbi:hypothetical protein M569_06850 [Genlisea aurea]|uniref:Glycosyl hydrolase family 32 N-terminal domain-containing protein n=1 Tax=Genlisea aurea TaxID=192259 RepID=S8CMI5_9LAMI|nr:hypothetical protein M569_06850 [Genlisea aurea]
MEVATTLASKWLQMKPQSLNRRNRFLPHCCYPSSSTATDEQNSSKSSIGLIFDLGPGNSWDGFEIGSPVVKRQIKRDGEERWCMWYHGRSGGDADSIGLAVSSDGVHWERGTQGVRSNADDDAGLVMSSSEDWWAFDTHGIRPSEVVVMPTTKSNASVFWLYYTGYYLSMESRKSLPGLAISQDGRNWARIEGGHHTGALLDAPHQRDAMFIASPHVVFHGPGDLRMYYHSLDVETGHPAIGIARSRDGMKWTVEEAGRKILGSGEKGAFDESGAINPRVVREDPRDGGGGGYLMAYEGVDSRGRSSIGMSGSRDGLREWRRLVHHPILEPSSNGWDSEGVGSPYLVQMDEHEWRLYYTGIGKDGRTGIGLASSSSSSSSQSSGEERVHNFQRWTGRD